MRVDLTGRIALVTGASRGIGRAIAERLAQAGATVCLNYRLQHDRAKETLQALEASGAHVFLHQADVSDRAQAAAMVQAVVERCGRIDILVNNAGINIRGAIDQLEEDEFRKVQQTNVEGVWRCCKAVVPHLKRQKAGRIINLASTLGVVGLENRTPYAASKGAVVQMTRALALELAAWNVTVNAICPGPFLTEMNVPIKDDEHAKKFIVGAVALGRWGELHEIQGAAIYLASDAGSFTTGSLLFVDGGWTAR